MLIFNYWLTCIGSGLIVVGMFLMASELADALSGDNSKRLNVAVHRMAKYLNRRRVSAFFFILLLVWAKMWFDIVFAALFVRFGMDVPQFPGLPGAELAEVGPEVIRQTLLIMLFLMVQATIGFFILVKDARKNVSIVLLGASSSFILSAYFLFVDFEGYVGLVRSIVNLGFFSCILAFVPLVFLYLGTRGSNIIAAFIGAFSNKVLVYMDTHEDSHLGSSLIGFLVSVAGTALVVLDLLI